MIAQELFALLAMIVIIAAGIGTFLSKNKPAMKDMFDNTTPVVKAPKIKPTQEPVDDHIEAVDAQLIKKVVDTAKVFPPEATINLEPAKPTKKKKYYPRKPKTHL